ncbi:MAG TPA: hypothetical protein QF630_06815 [Alphaproteobacteria bacterium]|nr:hypothetical protein [Alphaproteobacteria bacterium]
MADGALGAAEKLGAEERHVDHQFGQQIVKEFAHRADFVERRVRFRRRLQGLGVEAAGIGQAAGQFQCTVINPIGQRASAR